MDLISRSAIHNKICKHFNIPKDWDGDIAEPLQTVLDLIENEDCDYNVDAVVEEIKQASMPLGFFLIPDARYIGEEKAVEIVRKGGV